MAIGILIIGVVIFAIGISGQVALTRKRVQTANPGDRKSRRIILTLAAIIVGAWIIIAGIVLLLRGHAQAVGSHYSSALSTTPNSSTAAVVKIMS